MLIFCTIKYAAGWVSVWMDGWVDGRARLKIAYSKQKGLSFTKVISKLRQLNSLGLRFQIFVNCIGFLSNF